eukprot:360622-Chlamydomonas_euryale.AAC.26
MAHAGCKRSGRPQRARVADGHAQVTGRRAQGRVREGAQAVETTVRGQGLAMPFPQPRPLIHPFFSSRALAFTLACKKDPVLPVSLWAAAFIGAKAWTS